MPSRGSRGVTKREDSRGYSRCWGNQIALGDEIPVQAIVVRLIREGLDRHDAIHAVGSVLVGFMNDLLCEGGVAPSANEKYYEELEELEAAEWLESFR